MGFLARMMAASEGDLLDNPDVWTTTEGFTIANPVSSAGVLVNASRAWQISAVHACIRVLAEDVASLPLDVFRRKANGDRVKVPDHPLYDVLHRQPNNWQTSFEWRETMMGHVLLRGNAYSEIVPGPKGFVGQLIPLHPDFVFPMLRDNGTMAYSFRPPGKEPRTLLQHEVFHLRGISDDGIVGLFPLELQREVFGTAIATEEYGASMFRNGAQLGGIITHPKTLQKAGRDRIRKMLKRFTGSQNAFKTLLLEEDMKWTQVAMRARDAEFMLSRKFSVIEICRAFRMQPHKIQDLERSTFSNIEHQAIEHVVDTVRPWLVRWEQAISRDLILRPNTFYAEFNVDALLRGDIASRYTAYGIGVERGWLTRNEVRERENMNSLEGLDTPLRPLNLGDGTKVPEEDVQPNDSNEREAQFVKAAAERLANKELVAVGKATGKREGADLQAWLDEFYAGWAADLSEGLLIPYSTAQEFALAARGLLANSDGTAESILKAWERTRVGALTELGMMEGE